MHSRRLIDVGILIIFALTLAMPATSAQVAAKGRPDGLYKIEDQVLQEMAADGQADFFVWMTEKADLGPAGALYTKAEKGRFVYDTLVATADRTQAGLRRDLKAAGIAYEAFYISNKILVRKGNRTLLTALAARSDVTRVTANHKFQLQEPFQDAGASNVPEGIGPNVTFVKAPLVWELGYTGQSSILAGNDTGMQWDHPALISHYRGWDGSTANHNYNWWDATGTYPTIPGDGHGHGTHTSGTMVGDDGGSNQIGVAPGAQVIHCKNMTDSGGGEDSYFVECFQWDLAPWDLDHASPLPSMAPDAVNNSWGYWGGGQDQFRDEIQALQAAGILVEVSSGNEGPSCSTLRSPGDYGEVLTTGSVYHADAYPGTMSDFSGRGPSSLDPDSYFPDVTAPGEDIRSSVPGSTYAGGWSGTSMAGPHTTALVALMWSACPAMKGQVSRTIDIIQQTASPVTSYVGSCGGDYTTGPNNDWGYGTIDDLAAVQQALAQCVGTGTLQGTVTDGTTGLPIQGATVTAVWSGGHTWRVVTDAAGSYQLAVPIGLYDMTVAKFAYLTGTASGLEVVEDATTMHDLALHPAPAYPVSGTVKDAVSHAPLAATVEALGTPIAPVSTDPATGSYSIVVPQGTYTFRASASLRRPVELELAVDGDKALDFVLPPLPCILLVDDDDDAPDARPYFAAALDAMGQEYDVFDAGTANGDGPDLSTLQGYDMVFWFSGDKWGSVSAGPNSADETDLAAYLDGGGNLFLSSQDYLYDTGLTPFGASYLGIGSYTSDGGYATSLLGIAGDPIGDGLGPFSLTYPPGFSDYGDILNPAAGASAAFKAENTANTLDIDKTNGTWHTVFFATDWVPLYHSNASDGIAVLQRIVDWFGGCKPPATQTLTCGTITPVSRVDPYGRLYVRWLVEAVDEAGTPVGGAAVTASLTWPEGGQVTRTRVSHANGVARFHWGSQVRGRWGIDVSDMVLEGYTFADGANCFASVDY